MALRSFIVAALLAAQASLAMGSAFDLNYSGRMTDASGKPIAGVVDLEVRFFRAVSGGPAVSVPVIQINDVNLVQGLFSVPLVLPPADFHAVFDTTQETWVEVTDVTHARTLPRQRFSAVPFALKVPVDDDTIAFNNDGELKLNAPVLSNKYLKSDGAGGVLWVDLATGTGDMNKADYDLTNPGDGKVDAAIAADTAANAAQLNGQSAAYYTDAANIAETATRKWLSDTERTKLSGIITGADMLKSTYDTNADGKVNSAVIADSATTATQLNGQAASYYLNATNISTGTLADALIASTIARDSELPNLAAPGAIGGTTPAAGTFTALQANTTLKIKDAGSAFLTTIQAPSLGANYTLTLPTTDGNNNEVLKTDGSGVLSWVAQPTIDGSAVDTAGAVMNGDFSSNGLMERTGAGTYSVVTNNSANWNTAYTDRNKWDGGATGLVAATARTSLSLVPGTDVQTQDAGLQSIAGLTTAANQMIYTTGSDVYATTGLTSFGRDLLDDASVAAQQATLSLVPGTNVQAQDAGLQSIAGLATGADKMIYTTASDVYATTDLTAAGRAILDDADNTAQRTTLGLGSMATQAAGAVNITGGTIAGATISTPTFANDAISGDKLDGGVYSNFRSTGIWDQGTATTLQVSAANQVGVGVSPAYAVDVVGQIFNISNSRGSNSAKSGQIASTHYDVTEEPTGMIGIAENSAADASLAIGGGFSSVNAASAIRFYTAPNTTTVTGNQRMVIDSAGYVGIGNTGPTGRLDVQPPAGVAGIIARGPVGYAANLSEWRDSGNNLLASVDYKGRPNFPPTGNVITGNTAVTTLYVDPVDGNDTTSCTAVDAGACATINGALARVPKVIRETVTIKVLPATYNEQVEIVGFSIENGDLIVQGDGGNFTIDTNNTQVYGILVSNTLGHGDVIIENAIVRETTAAGIRLNWSRSTLKNVTATANTGSGVYAFQSYLELEGAISLTSNSNRGLECTNQSVCTLNASSSLTATGNLIGLSVEYSSKASAASPVTLDSNTNQGLLVVYGSVFAQSAGAFSASSNTSYGIYVFSNSSFVSGTTSALDVNNNGGEGVLADNASLIHVTGTGTKRFGYGTLENNHTINGSAMTILRGSSMHLIGNGTPGSKGTYTITVKSGRGHGIYAGENANVTGYYIVADDNGEGGSTGSGVMCAYGAFCGFTYFSTDSNDSYGIHATQSSTIRADTWTAVGNSYGTVVELDATFNSTTSATITGSINNNILVQLMGNFFLSGNATMNTAGSGTSVQLNGASKVTQSSTSVCTCSQTTSVQQTSQLVHRTGVNGFPSVSTGTSGVTVAY